MSWVAFSASVVFVWEHVVTFAIGYERLYWPSSLILLPSDIDCKDASVLEALIIQQAPKDLGPMIMTIARMIPKQYECIKSLVLMRSNYLDNS